MSELLDKINKEFKYSCLGAFDAINPKDLPKIINLCMDAAVEEIENSECMDSEWGAGMNYSILLINSLKEQDNDNG